MLKIFYESYNSCREVLIANKITEENGTNFHGVDLYNSIYEPYNRKLGYIIDEIGVREETVKYWYNDSAQVNETGEIPVGNLVPFDNTKPPGKVQEYYAEMTATQKALDIKQNLGDLWTTMFNYLRESDYQNSNYISDGLSNNELIERAAELIDKAKLELDKASEMQYTLSDDLFNLLNTEDFAPFKDKFNLGDFIVCSVGDNKDNFDLDDQNYRLRLLSLSYSYGSPDSISVSFSNVTKIKNYFSDTQDILAQAKSMSSSYPVVSHQVDKNTATTTTVNKWNDNGLKSALTRIMNNNHEEVSYDDGGIIVKEYDYDLKETNDDQNYSNDQLRITHNILAFTSDNWKSASLGLGRQNYKYYDTSGVLRDDGDDYGLIAKFVDAGYIHGTQIIGGEIYSQNYAVTDGVPTEGTHLKLDDGTFTMCGNLFKGYYDSTNQRYKIDITGDIHATSLTLEPGADIPDLGYVKYDHPYGTVQEGSVGYQLSSAGLLTATNAVIYGTIYAGAGYIGSSATVADRWAIGDKGIYKGINSTSASGNGSYIGTDGIKTVQDDNSVLIQNGSITANSCNFTGGKIGGWEISSTQLQKETSNTSFISLKSSDKSIISRNGDLKTVMTAGYNKYYYDEKEMGIITSSGSFSIGENLTIKKGFHIEGVNYIDRYGNQRGDCNYLGIVRPGHIMSMIIDNGNNPIYGRIEPIKIFDDVVFYRNIYMSSDITVNGNVNIGVYDIVKTNTWDMTNTSLTKAIGAIYNKINSLVYAYTFTKKITGVPSGESSHDLTGITISGYTPIMVVCEKTGAPSHYMRNVTLEKSSSSATKFDKISFTVERTSSSASTNELTFQFRVLYIKD